MTSKNNEFDQRLRGISSSPFAPSTNVLMVNGINNVNRSLVESYELTQKADTIS